MFRIAALIGAFVLGVATTATAATLITSRMIKDNTIQAGDMATGSVQSRVIRDGSIKANDLASDLASGAVPRPEARFEAGPVATINNSATSGIGLEIRCSDGHQILSWGWQPVTANGNSIDDGKAPNINEQVSRPSVSGGGIPPATGEVVSSAYMMLEKVGTDAPIYVRAYAICDRS